jgi:tetratricopeptide (TPR) repeat protein
MTNTLFIQAPWRGNMVRILIAAVILLLFPGRLALFGQVRLDQDAAERLLIERPSPFYPELAERARINEPVLLLASVSETGVVMDVKVLRGHPLLNGAAIESAYRSTYKPYIIDGKATSFSAPAEIIFGLSPRDYGRDRKLAVQFFDQEDKCRDLLNASDWQKAEEACSANLAIADKLGKHRSHMKVRAYRMAGLAVLNQNRYEDALKLLKRALDIGKSNLLENDANVGDVYIALGLAYSKMGKNKEAIAFYIKGEKALQIAFQSVRVAGYLPRLKNALKLHIEAAEAAGDAKELEAAKKKLEAMP